MPQMLFIPVAFLYFADNPIGQSMDLLLAAAFVLGCAAIAFERHIKINKAGRNALMDDIRTFWP